MILNISFNCQVENKKSWGAKQPVGSCFAPIPKNRLMLLAWQSQRKMLDFTS